MNEKESIFEYVKENGPVSIVEISDSVGLSVNPTRRLLVQLRDEGKINKLNGTRRAFYEVPSGITYQEMTNLKQVISKETVKVKENCFDVEDKVNALTRSVNAFYANIISLMSVFVAIFALITVNANIAITFIKDDIWNGVAAVAIINGVVIICIIVLLLLVRLIIISPLLKTEKVNEVE